MSPYTPLSDHCNSIPSSRSVIHSEPSLNILVDRIDRSAQIICKLNYMYVFYVFFKIQKNMTFYVFFSCCTRFPQQWIYPIWDGNILLWGLTSFLLTSFALQSKAVWSAGQIFSLPLFARRVWRGSTIDLARSGLRGRTPTPFSVVFPALLFDPSFSSTAFYFIYLFYFTRNQLNSIHTMNINIVQRMQLAHRQLQGWATDDWGAANVTLAVE